MKTIITVCMAAACVLLLASCQKADPQAAMREKNKAAMKAINDAFTSGDVGVLDTYIAPDVIEHSPDPMMKGTGLEAVKGMLKSLHAMYPDFTVTTNYMVAEGDLVVSQSTMTGTNSGSVEGMPATNKRINVDGVDIVRFKDGKGIEHWGYYDAMKMMQQLGMMPPPGGEMGKPQEMGKEQEKK